MNRFKKRKFRIGGKRITYISTLLFVALLILFLFGINSISSSSIEKQQESLETALKRDIVHCYAVEGAYPPSLDYIKKHYGLTYNEELFFVDYQPLATNLMPDVTILPKKNQKGLKHEQ